MPPLILMGSGWSEDALLEYVILSFSLAGLIATVFFSRSVLPGSFSVEVGHNPRTRSDPVDLIARGSV